MSKKVKRIKREFLKMTQQEKEIIFKLANCSMLPGSFDKRYINCMLINANIDNYEISDKGKVFLNKLLYKYRRQIDPLFYIKNINLKTL